MNKIIIFTKKLNYFLLLFHILFFFTIVTQALNVQTILTPTPLCTMVYKNNTPSIVYGKTAILPLTGLFYYNIQKNSLIHDIEHHPILTTIITSCILYYAIHYIYNNQQIKIENNILNIIQHLFHLLIIAHGMYNKITNPSTNRINTTALSTSLISLEIFLEKAYNAWNILFEYFQELYPKKQLYIYNMNEIDILEVLQAGFYEPEIMPLLIHFCDKNYSSYEYETIIECLESKLKLISHKIAKTIPDHY
ncbi:MAG: hypothetical protein ACXWL5_03695 [Candidatus Chromulinivorax sp.]